MTFTNQTNGVEVRIYSGVSNNVDLTNYELREVNNHYLSQECGETFRKCNQPLVVTVNNPPHTESSGETSIVIFPLSRALGLLALHIVNDTIGDELVVKDLTQYDCNPTSIYRIRNSHYIICSNAGTGYIRLLELKLNGTHLQESTVSDLEYLDIDSAHNRTNTLYVDLPSRSGSVIYFASGYNLYYFKPLDYLTGELSVDLQGSHCSATAIDYVGGWEMIVYCEDDRAVYISIDRESIFESVEYSKEGRPYVCPNPDVYLGVITETEYIKYAFRSTKQVMDYGVPMSNFDNGVCLGTEDVTLFAFTDQQRGTRLFNATGSYVHLLSDTACTNYPCQPLVVLQDRYLVIREKRRGIWYSSLFDSHENFSLALEAKHSRADLIAIVESQNMVNCSPADVGRSSYVLSASTTPVLKPQYNAHIGLFIITASAAVVAVVLVVLCTLCVCIYVRHRKCTSLDTIVVSVPNIGFEQRRDITGHSTMVAGIAMEGIYIV